MGIEKVRPIDRVLEIFYSFAAVPVLLGALFKITHTAPFGEPDTWLYVGLGTEALVFCTFGFLYWFAPPKAVDEMGVPIASSFSDNKKVVEVAVGSSNGNINMPNVSPESIQKINDGFKHLEANLEKITAGSNSVVNTEAYLQKLQEATDSLASINTFYSKLSETSQALANSADDAKQTQLQIAILAQNLAKLNQAYGGMLTAMQVNR